MNILEIGKNIFKLRKGKRITQDELAKVVGVSVAAVSKWEGGASYPDITLLPVIADFFEVSIDDLMSYEHNISQEEIEKISLECMDLFDKDEESALSTCNKYIRKYTKVYSLKVMIATTYMLRASSTKDEEKKRLLFTKALAILNDVVSNCNDDEIVQVAITSGSSICTQLNDYDTALEMLNKIKTTTLDIEAYKGNVYIKKGEVKKGTAILQKSLLNHISHMDGILMLLIDVNKEIDNEKAQKYFDLKRNICKALEKDETSADYMTELSIIMEQDDFEKQVEGFKKLLLKLEEEKNKSLTELNLQWYISDIEFKEKKSSSGAGILRRLQKTVLDNILNDVKYEEILKRKDIMEIVDRISE